MCLTKQSFFTCSTACRTRFCFFPTLSTTSLSTCTPVGPSIRPSLLSTPHGDVRCEDPSNVSSGPLAEPHSPTGYEPKVLTGEDTSMLIKPMFIHRPSMTSTYDSPENIATPPPWSDLDDEQVWNMLASPLYLQEREVSADRSQDSFRENSAPSSSHFRESAGKFAAVFSHKRKSGQETGSDRRRHFLRTSTSSRKIRSSIQTLWIGKYCETSP